MARPNPGWAGNAALGAAPDAAPAGTVIEGDFAPVAVAPAPGGPVRVALDGAAGQVVLSLLVTGDTPGEAMPETAALIARLHGGAGGEAAMTVGLARCLKSLLVRTAVPPEVEEEVASLIASIQLQVMGAA